MDATTFIALASLCAPLVHPSTAQATALTESGFNPHTIGVVAGSLERQPRSLEEALATAQARREQGRNFSVGLAQINVHNLNRFGMSAADGFDACKNLRAMRRVLRECFEQAALRDREQQSLQRALFLLLQRQLHDWLPP
jgi:type IV secretion system protein VirB1